MRRCRVLLAALTVLLASPTVLLASLTVLLAAPTVLFASPTVLLASLTVLPPCRVLSASLQGAGCSLQRARPREMSSRLYSTDLAFIHHVGHGEFARRVAPEIIRILRANGIARGLIVEAGCGSGILAAQLVAAGYNVLGIDQSAAMIRLARATAPAARFRVASLAHASIPPCRAIIATGEVITYVGRREASAFIRRAGARLEPGDLFVFDFIESGAHRTYALRTRVGDGWSLTSRASLNAPARLLTRHIATARQIRGTLRRVRETHRVRIYRRSDIAAVLATAGFAFTMRRRFGRCPLLPGNVAVIARKLRTPGTTL